jgi:hypothetical protein
MIRLSLSAIGFLGLFALQAQVAPIPTSWDMETALPPGWSTNQPSGGEFYTAATCNTITPNNRSFRLDATGRFLMVELAAAPGPVAYEIGGQTGSAPYFNGTFLIQESIDGVTWNTIKTYTGAQSIPDQSEAVNCLQDTAFPTNPSVRFIRWFFQTKFSGNASTGGGNVKLDHVSIAETPFLQPKLRINQSGNVLFNNQVTTPVSVAPGNSTTMGIVLENQAIAGPNLRIDSIRISGVQLASFAFTPPSFPQNLNYGQTLSLNLNFSPAVPGSYEAILSVYSNDFTQDSVYQITLYGVGGNLASIPSFAASGLQSAVNKSYRQILNLNVPATGPDAYGGYIVLRAEGAAVSGSPQDGQTYLRGASIGNSKVIYVGNPQGTSASLRPNWNHANTQYHYAVYSFNGTGTFTRYNTSPLTTQITSAGSMLSPTYYSGVDPTQPSFVSDLHDVIKNHTHIFYSQYAQTMIMGFEIRDTLLVSGTVIRDRALTCCLSGRTTSFGLPFAYAATGISREHTFPHSWFPTNPADSPERPEFADQHNLYPIEQLVNEQRCNYPFARVNSPINVSGEGTLGLDTAGNRVYEPATFHKGRAARAIMYMVARYNSISGNAWNFNAPVGQNCSGIPINYPQNPQVLLNWHFDFPPNKYEIARNDFLDSLQGNRNPFVDNPNWACYINFSNMTWIENPTVPCATLGDSPQTEQIQLSVWPNPSSERINLSFWHQSGGPVHVELHDLSGRSLYRYSANEASGNVLVNIPVNQFPAGLYLLRVNTADGSSSRKVSVNH